MNGSIRSGFTLTACLILGLTLCAPYMSRAQESSSDTNIADGGTATTDSADELEDVLNEFGIDSKTDDTPESDSSWLDRIAAPFQSSDPIDDTTDEDIDPSVQESTTSDNATNLPIDSSSTLVEPTQPDSSSSTTDASAVTSQVENIDAHTETESVSIPPAQPTNVVTLDDLLRQTRNTPQLKQEALHSSLAERRRLAISMRATLEAAKQVATYGHASTQLLQDASLDTIVATMIAEQKHEQQDDEAPSESMSDPSSQSIIITSDDTIDDVSTDFQAWRLAYIMKESGRHRIGWRHTSNGERTSAHVGDSLTFGNDVVAIIKVDSDKRGRYLVIDINGERRDVYLF